MSVTSHRVTLAYCEAGGGKGEEVVGSGMLCL